MGSSCTSLLSVLVLVSSGIYRMRHSRKGAIVGLILGVLSMGLVMMPTNHVITPLFMAVPVDVVDALLLPVILPFNLLKAGVNALVTFLVYKTISRHIVHGQEWKKDAVEPVQEEKPELSVLEDEAGETLPDVEAH